VHAGRRENWITFAVLANSITRRFFEPTPANGLISGRNWATGGLHLPRTVIIVRRRRLYSDEGKLQ